MKLINYRDIASPQTSRIFDFDERVDLNEHETIPEVVNACKCNLEMM
jgi:hypothetical protein